ncbi:hypothetical protein ACU4GD_01740 [Cupriavidus basilensis]
MYSLQDYYAAKDAALRALALAPANAGVLSNYANTLKETGDVAEAVAVLRKAIALSRAASWSGSACCLPCCSTRTPKGRTFCVRRRAAPRC